MLNYKKSAPTSPATSITHSLFLTINVTTPNPSAFPAATLQHSLQQPFRIRCSKNSAYTAETIQDFL